MKKLHRLKVMFNNCSLAFKLAVMFALCSIVILSVNYVVVSRLIYTSAWENVLSSNQVAASQVTTTLDYSFSSVLRSMARLRTEVQMAVKSDDSQDTAKEYTDHYNAYQTIFSRLIADNDNYPMIFSLQVANASGDAYLFSWSGSRTMDRTPTFEELSAWMTSTDEYQWCCIPGNVTEDGERLISILTAVRRYGNIHGVISVNLRENYLGQYLAACELSGDTFLYSPKEHDLYGLTDPAYLDKDSLLEMLAGMGEKETLQQGKYVILREPLGVNEWSLVCCVPTEELMGQPLRSRVPVMLLFLGSGLLAALMSILIARNVTSPLKKLTGLMRRVEHDELTSRFAPRYHDEIGILASSYDEMMDEIVRLTDRIREDEQQQKITYMKLLQMQIKPHFLYNSLETTRFMVEMKDPQAVTMIKALSRFYKLMLGTLAETATTSEELEQIEAYLTIMQIRYSRRFTYEITMAPGTEKARILRFLMQPVVENAIYHGIKMIRRPGLIRITLTREGDDLLISVWDNGKGMTAEEATALRQRIEEKGVLEKGVSIGLGSVHQRMRLTYGPQYGVTFTSVPDEYTEMVLRQPLNTAEGGDGHVSPAGG